VRRYRFLIPVIGRYAGAVDDAELLAQLLAGDEKAFAELVRRYHESLIRVALYYVSSRASAEDVAQETWIAVMKGADRFEGRSTFKTWLFRILANRARTTGVREHRTVPVDPTDTSASVAARRFDEGGAWREPPVPFTESVDDAIGNETILRLVHDAIRRLPEPQQAVVTLRDVEGLSTMEVALLLELSEANVRVILHRGRAKVRGDVEAKLSGGGS
jgi:RNA polymerase sigma-70 factor (ECF subfamily)